MVKAGAQALLEFDRRFEDEKDAAVRIYEAMIEAGKR